MTTEIKAQNATIKEIDTTVINVNQGVTNVKWNPSKKQEDIFLLNSTETAKLLDGKSGEKAILGDISYTIGTDSDSIRYVIHQGSIIHVGFATLTRDLATISPGSDLISETYAINKDTIMTLALTPTTLTITYGNVKRIVDISGFAGQVMYPWLSDDTNGTGFSVSISRVSALKVYVESNGDIVFNSVTASGVDTPIRFETGTTGTVSFSGPLGLSAPSQLDVVETTNPVTNLTLRVNSSLNEVIINTNGDITVPGLLDSAVLESSSGPLVLREQGGLDITIDTLGDVVIPGSATADSLISNSLLSVLGTDLSLHESTGLGLTVTDGTGLVKVSDSMEIGNGGTVNTVATMTTFSSTPKNRGIVLPVVTNTILSPNPGFTFLTGDLLPGMVVFDNATSQFKGWNGSAFVVLG